MADELGQILADLLADPDYDIQSVKSYHDFSIIYDALNKATYNVLILTNNCLSPEHIKQILPIVNNFYPQIKTIVASSFYDDKYINTWNIGGADAILRQPLDIDTFKKEIKRLLSS